MTNASRQGGYTMVEVLVAIVVFSIVSAGLYQVLVAQAGVAEHTRSISHIASESRLGFNRMVRDVREADAITWVSPSRNQFTIQVNYDGNGFYENPNANGDDEILTYTYDPVAETVTLCNAIVYSSCNSSNTEILMSGTRTVDASTPVFSFSSSNLEYDWGNDAGGAPDGVTTWEEIDEASGAAHNIVGVGNDNDVLDAAEFPFLTTVAFAMKQTNDGRSTDFYGRAQLRNRS
ncbi:MAG: prepilin-type N-terminal cleavage/methylation domain-containing protein [Actinomycetota bacterium]|nr:prepilin-type N-terminal cleavage/methylation domain-containing protein [Actinomycetota bacterium]